MMRHASNGLRAGTRPRLLLTALLPLAAAVVVAVPASAHSYKLGTIDIGHVWSPPGDGLDVPVYGPLFQTGPSADRLVSASSSIGKSVEIQDKSGTTKSWGKGIELKPGVPVSLASFHDHLEVAGVTKPLKAGDTFPLTLNFQHAGSITVQIEVQKTPGE